MLNVKPEKEVMLYFKLSLFRNYNHELISKRFIISLFLVLSISKLIINHVHKTKTEKMCKQTTQV